MIRGATCIRVQLATGNRKATILSSRTKLHVDVVSRINIQLHTGLTERPLHFIIVRNSPSIHSTRIYMYGKSSEKFNAPHTCNMYVC